MNEYSFDFGLGETIDALRESVASFCAKELAPIASKIDESNEFPRSIWPKLGELGVLGMTVEQSFGLSLIHISEPTRRM